MSDLERLARAATAIVAAGVVTVAVTAVIIDTVAVATNAIVIGAIAVFNVRRRVIVVDVTRNRIAFYLNFDE